MLVCATVWVVSCSTDVDAVCSSLSYARLMRALGYNCKAKVSSPINRETQFIAQRFGFDVPELKTAVAAGTRLILTDHTDYAQCVDGNLLCTRWKDAGAVEQREWWEIASLADGQMEWTALRKRPDGTTFVQGTKWKKVE